VGLPDRLEDRSHVGEAVIGRISRSSFRLAAGSQTRRMGPAPYNRGTTQRLRARVTLYPSRSKRAAISRCARKLVLPP